MRWYVAYPLSLRHLEQMMAERNVAVDHSTIAPLGDQVAAGTAQGISPAQAPGGQELAHERNVCPHAWPMEVSLSSGGQVRRHHRLPTTCQPRPRRRVALLRQGD